MLVRAGLFIGTFSLIWILLGMTATAIGQTLNDNLDTLEKIAGIAIIAMGVFFILALFIPVLNRDWHPDVLMSASARAGRSSSGQRSRSPGRRVSGPALGAILGLAAVHDTVAEGGALLAVYSAGLALPFLLTAIAFNRATTAFNWIKRHYAIINGFAGVLLIAIGVLVLSGELFRLNVEVQNFLDNWNLNFFQDV